MTSGTRPEETPSDVEKLPYATPKLTRFGSIRDLTYALSAGRFSDGPTGHKAVRG